MLNIIYTPFKQQYCYMHYAYAVEEELGDSSISCSRVVILFSLCSYWFLHAPNNIYMIQSNNNNNNPKSLVNQDDTNRTLASSNTHCNVFVCVYRLGMQIID